MRILSSRAGKVCFALGLFHYLLANFVYAETVVNSGVKMKTDVYEVKLGTDFENLNFGYALFTQKISPLFPVVIKTGNLSSGGILSKMKQPLLAGLGSPFGSGSSSVNGITTTLASSNVFSKPMSSFFQFGISPKQKRIPNLFLNCWYSPDEEMITTSLFSSCAFLKNKIKLKSALCIGQFPYSENDSSSWLVDEPYFLGGEHLISSLSSSLSLWNFYFYFGLNTFETPFGSLLNSYRADAKFSGKHFIYSLSSAYNGEKVISASDDKIKELLQLRLNLQYKDVLRLKMPLFWKIGVTTFGNIKLTEIEQQLKAAFGLQLRYGIVALSLSSAINSILDTEDINYPIWSFESCSFKSLLNIAFPYIVTSLTFGVILTPTQNLESVNPKYSGKLQLSNTGKTRINSSLSYSCSLKNDLLSSQKMSLGCSVEFKRSVFSYSFKVATDFEISI